MIKSLVFAMSLILAQSFGQVTYSNTPTQEDLEAYFFDGLKIINLTVPTGAALRYQFVDARTMNVISDNEIDFAQRDASGYLVDQSRFVLSFNTNGNFNCCTAVAGSKCSIVSVRIKITYTEANGLQSYSSGGSSSIVELNQDFNMGHWTDILNASSPLPYNTWIPITAFIPNYYDGQLTYASAGEWFVLLVLFDNGSDTEPPLTQAELIERIRDYGINPNP